MDIIEAIKTNRPNLSDSSIRTYISCINRIAKGINKNLLTDEDILENIDEIMKWLERYSANPRKTKIASIITTIDKKPTEEQSDKLKEILEKLRAEMWRDAEEIKNKDESQTLTEEQKKNWIPWKDVVKRWEQLRIEAEPLFKLEKLTRNQFFLLQNFILLSLYVLIPPRRSQDWTDFKLRDYDTSTESKDNYMVIPDSRKKPAYFVFNSYKNSKRLGQQRVDIPNYLKLLILKWGKVNPSDYLITNQFQQKVAHSRITMLLNNIFGKSISSTLLRHIYLTDKLGSVDLKKLKDITSAIGNSEIERTLSYVSKEHYKE